MDAAIPSELSLQINHTTKRHYTASHQQVSNSVRYTSFKHFLLSLSSWQIRPQLHAVKDEFKSILTRTRNIIEILKMFAYLRKYIKRCIVVCIFLYWNLVRFHIYSINECLHCSLHYTQTCYASFQVSTTLSFMTQK
jgi:hypothetical protein